MLDPEARALIGELDRDPASSADSQLSWFPRSALSTVERAVAGGPLPAAAARRAGVRAAVSVEHRICGRDLLGGRCAAWLARIDRARRGKPVVARRQVRLRSAGVGRSRGRTSLLQQLRAGASSSRRSWLLDITTDIGIPCIAALSCRPDGRGLAFGLASRLTLQAAARSAIFELCQIELAYAVIEAKRSERGEAALNAKDRVHVQRAMAIDADQCALLRPGPGRAEHIAIDPSDKPLALQAIVRRLGELGISDLRPRFDPTAIWPSPSRGSSHRRCRPSLRRL